jgi:hypothetical protein
MLALALTFGLVLSGCKEDDVGEYDLKWGLWINETYANISAQFNNNNVPLTSAGPNAGYLTGNNATAAYNFISSYYSFYDYGSTDGSFEDLVNYKKDGIGAPVTLKDALRAQKANAPLAGVFQYQNYVLLFYLSKN